MNKPRYTVGSVTGYSTGAAISSHPATLWYVHDSAYSYRVVQEFIGIRAEKRALELAQRLNDGKGMPKRRKRRGLRPIRRLLPPPPMDAWRASLATHCRNGHKYTDKNTLWVRATRGTQRDCRICKEARRKAA
jgi:hypothetical protein